MKLDEVIQELSDCMSETEKLLSPKTFSAHKLGIKALKLYKHNRLIGAHHDPVLLPGETEE